MILIIWGHLTNKFSIEEPILGLNYLESHLVKSFTIVAVNVFILISGYFSISFCYLLHCFFILAIIEKIRLYIFDKLENKIDAQIMKTKIARNIENRITLMN